MTYRSTDNTHEVEYVRREGSPETWVVYRYKGRLWRCLERTWFRDYVYVDYVYVKEGQAK